MKLASCTSGKAASVLKAIHRFSNICSYPDEIYFREGLPYPEGNAKLHLIQQHLFPHERKILERPRTVDQLENY